MFTEDDLLSFSKEDRFDTYRKFFTAYISAEELDSEKLLRKYSGILSRLETVWLLSVADINCLKNEVLDKRSRSSFLLNEFVADIDETTIH